MESTGPIISTSSSSLESACCCEADAEAAEARKSDADKAEATALAEKIASETPQERAAREREEMAARGRF